MAVPSHNNQIFYHREIEFTEIFSHRLRIKKNLNRFQDFKLIAFFQTKMVNSTFKHIIYTIKGPSFMGITSKIKFTPTLFCNMEHS